MRHTQGGAGPFTRLGTLLSLGASSLGFSLSGCNDNTNPSMTRAERADFDKTVAKLEDAGYHVREALPAGPLTVAYFTDLHSEDEVSRTKTRMDGVREIFPFTSGGFEGYSGPIGPEAARDTTIDKRIQEIVDRNPDKLMTADEAQSLGFTSLPRPTIYGSYNSYVELNGMQAVGLESDNFNHVSGWAAMEVNKFYADVISVLTNKASHRESAFFMGEFGFAYIMGINDRYLTVPHLFSNAQDYLKELYPDMPMLDMNNHLVLKFEGQENEVMVFSNHQFDYLLAQSMRFDDWLQKHFVFGRNKDAADIMARHLQTHGETRGAMVFGLGHSVDGGPEHKSIQRYLVDQGVSCIVIDPYHVEKRKKLGGDIEFLIDKKEPLLPTTTSAPSSSPSSSSAPSTSELGP